jgi:esterase/lipase superfamily enzyme
MYSPLRIAFVFIAVLALAGCVNSDSGDLLTATERPAATSAIAATHEIYIATTRQRSAKPLEGFSGARSPQTEFASVKVSVPAIHEVGNIERRKGKVGDPSRYFTATNLSVYNQAGFTKTLRADIARNNGRVLVFVHGYRTGFDSAVYRVTQIVHDAGFKGTPLLFSWASGGRTVDYVYDNNSATAARDSLEQALRLLAANGAKRIDIIAHSMGNWATMEALRQLAIANDRTLGGKLGDVILASPDLDVDVFKAQMARYGKPEKPFVIMLSKDDRGVTHLWPAGRRQAARGDYGNAAELAKLGVVVVDLSQVEGDRLGIQNLPPTRF